MTSLPQELLKQVTYPRSPRLISVSLTYLEDTMENVISKTDVQEGKRGWEWRRGEPVLESLSSWQKEGEQGQATMSNVGWSPPPGSEAWSIWIKNECQWYCGGNTKGLISQSYSQLPYHYWLYSKVLTSPYSTWPCVTGTWPFSITKTILLRTFSKNSWSCSFTSGHSLPCVQQLTKPLV